MVSFADYFFLYSLAISVFYFGCGNCYWPNQENSLVPVNTNIRSDCRTLPGGTLRIEGNNVKLSDFLRNNQICFGSFNNKTTKKLDIFAINQVYLDVDIEAEGRELDVSIIAPRVQIVGYRKMNLRGSDGQTIDTIAIRSKSGNPGLPGNPGGNFLVIAENIIADSYLDVFTRGGNGSDGQNGGNGKNSTNGDQFKPSYSFFFENQCNNNAANTKSGKPVSHQLNCTNRLMKTSLYSKNNDKQFTDYTYSRVKVFKPFIPAENGGDGGKGGEAGKPGKSVILQIGGNTSFARLDSKSFDGKAGSAGKKGIGGSKNGPVVLYDSEVVSPLSKNPVTNFEQIASYNLQSIAPDGRDGIPGGNTQGLIHARVARDPRAGHTINEYMSFVFQNSRAESVGVNGNFLAQLCREESAGNLHDSLSLAEEFIVLEENVYFLKSKFDFIPCYKSLLTRISNYAVTPVVQNSLQEKKLLSYLYTATLSKIRNLNDYSETRLVINFPVYLHKVERSIKSLMSLQSEQDKLKYITAKINRITFYREEYKRKIDDKINEIWNFTEQFKPEITKTEEEIDEVIKKLLQDIKDLKNSTQKNIWLLVMKKKDLQKQLAIKITFGVIGILSAFLLFLGPIGIAAAAVIGSVSAVTQSLVLSGGTQPNMEKLTASFKASKEMIVAIQNMKKERLKTILDQLAREAKNMPDISETMAETIAHFREKVKSIKNLEECELTKKELLKELEATQQNLIRTKNAKYDKAVKVFQKFVATTQVIENSYNLYQTISNDTKQMSIYDAAIEESRKHLQLLKVLEANFNEVIIPSIKDMEVDFHELIKNLYENSRVSLIMTKWKVQKKLRDLKSQVQRSLTSLPSSSKIEATFRNLEIIMGVLIDVFDLMQVYQDDKGFADYIADITSASAQDIDMSDDYEMCRRRLDMVISSNVILQEYGLVLNSFKQFAFPMAERYLKNFVLPSQLELKDNIHDLVISAKQQMESLRENYDEYISVLSEDDKCVYKTRFNSESKVTTPFYRWKGKKGKTIIKRLLTGEEVVVMVDVRSSSKIFNAIKFQFIKLNFKVRDKRAQPKIYQKLDHYMVFMSHLGDSYYRFNDKIYKIQTDIFEFSYSHEMDPRTNEPRVYSESWKKLKRAAFMLSPYALWKIQLRRFSKDSFENNNQSNLKSGMSNWMNIKSWKKYINKIELELVGIGSYIRTDRYEDCKHFQEDSYYKSIQMLANETSSKIEY